MRVVLSVLGSILICSWIYAIQKHLLLFIVGKDVCGPQFVKLLAVIALGWELGEEGKNELEYTHSGEECVEWRAPSPSVHFLVLDSHRTSLLWALHSLYHRLESGRHCLLRSAAFLLCILVSFLVIDDEFKFLGRKLGKEDNKQQTLFTNKMTCVTYVN